MPSRELSISEKKTKFGRAESNSVKREEVCLKAYESVVEARAGIGAYLNFSNNERPHQALARRTPAQVSEEGRSLIHRTEVIVTSKLVPV